jgi:3-dehydroshikimate dehydratase
MNLSLCTISFRHHLASMTDLARWARACHFDSLEIWGVHARNLMDQAQYNRQWLADYGLTVSMLSDYLPLQGSEQASRAKVQLMCQLARHWGAGKLRTFAGDQASAAVDAHTRQRMAQRLRNSAKLCADYGITLVVETHPNTLADSLSSIHQLLAEVDCVNVKLNFDVLHVWESGAEPCAAFDELHAHIAHLHLKNIDHTEHLQVFAPSNVYSPSGERTGMVPLFNGAVDYWAFLQHLQSSYTEHYHRLEASLEWFGNDSWQVLNDDRYRVQQCSQANWTASIFKQPANTGTQRSSFRS